MRNNPESFREFESWIANGNDFIEELQTARDRPDAKESYQTLRKVMRTLTCAGKGVPWSGEERKAELTHLYALWRFCGVPTCLLTAAIDDAHQPTTMRLSYGIIVLNQFPATMGSFLENLQNAGKDGNKFAEFHKLYKERSDNLQPNE